MEDLQKIIVGKLTGLVDESLAVELAEELMLANTGSAVLALLDELGDLSRKTADAAIEALPELRRRGALAGVVAWLDLGIALTESSGAAAMKYFKESPLILGLIEPDSSRRTALAVALELADADPNVALNFFRTAPELLTVIPATQLAPWAEVGMDLARGDYVLGIEFFHHSPSAARVLPLELVRDWVALGMKLITRNSLGKIDYLGTLEFFRTSANLFGEVEGAKVRKGMIDVGSALAGSDPAIAVSFLAESPAILRRLPSEDWRSRTLQYGVFVAERDSEAAMAYFRRCPELVAWLGSSGDAQTKFDDWSKEGMEVLGYSLEGGRAYFSMETKKALASVEHAISGVPLRQIARSLKLFVQGLCGTDIVIESAPEPLSESVAESTRARVGVDGRTIALPAIVRRFPTREENTRLYMVMIAHEAGHFEFGTYDLQLASLQDLIAEVRSRYRRSSDESVRNLADLFRLYPQSGIIRDLWTILEDARVEYRLQQEYPGLRRDLAMLAREAVQTRSLSHGMSAREMAVDCLLLLTTAEPGTVRIQNGIHDIVERMWKLGQSILTPTATAADAVKLADRLYAVMDEMMATQDEAVNEGMSTPESDNGPSPRAAEEISKVYRPVTNWAYRGDMDPDQVKYRQEPAEAETPAAGSVAVAGLSQSAVTKAPTVDENTPLSTSDSHGELRREHSSEGPDPASSVEDLFKVSNASRERCDSDSRSVSFLYDEWDGSMMDYRSRWCRVVERHVPSEETDFADAALAAHKSSAKLLRRYFESLRPPRFRRAFGQMDGEDIDLDAAINRKVDCLAGTELSERVYVRREKKERDVAVAFLVDLSGSTARQIGLQGRRVVDVEKEGLVLLSQALDAIGDQYAIYGYSGQGRRHIDFVVVKEFDEPPERMPSRLGNMIPLQQNRDGAAIRHALHKLLACETRVRLLMLISDGKPLDDAYADDYALEDTKMALQEVRMQGIQPFCITVDQEADAYLRRMYGDVRFLVIDRVETLPERLPKVYRRLTA